MHESGEVFSKFAVALPEKVRGAAALLAIPHWFDEPLAAMLCHEFLNTNGDTPAVVAEVVALPFVYPYEGRRWRFEPTARRFFAGENGFGPVFERLCTTLVKEYDTRRTAEPNQNGGWARQLLWQAAYHEVPVRPESALRRLDELLKYGDEFGGNSEFKAAADFCVDREHWLSRTPAESAYFQGRYAYARRSYNDAQKFFEFVWRRGERNSLRRATAGHLLAVLIRKREGPLGYPQAVALLREALEIAVQAGDRYAEIHIRNTLAATLRLVRTPAALAEAEEHAVQAVELSDQEHSLRCRLITRQTFGEVLLTARKADAAVRVEQIARDWMEVASERADLAGILPYYMVLHGKALAAQYRLADAAKVLEDALALWPENRAVAQALITVRRKRGDSRRVESFEHALTTGRQSARKMAIRASLLKSRKEFSEARKLYERALQRDPENSRTLVGYADLLKRVGEFAEAEQFVARALKVDPESPRALRLYADILFSRGDEHAIEHYERALAAGPQTARSLAIRATLRKRRGDLATARQLYEQALQIDPDNVRTLLGYVGLLQSIGELEAADSVGERAVSLAPENPRALQVYADLLHSRGDPRAVEHYERALAAGPQTGRTLSIRASLLKRRGDLAGALKLYNQALQLDPTNERTLVGVADVLSKTGENARALDYYIEALRLAPRNRKAAMRVGRLVAAVFTDPADALGALERVPNLHAHPQLLHLSALSMWRIRRTSEALEQIRVAYTLAPDSIGIRWHFSGILQSAGPEYWPEALEQLNWLVERRPNISKFSSQRDRVAKMCRAWRARRSALPEGTKNQQLFYEIGKILEHEGEFTLAAELYRKAIESGDRRLVVKQRLGIIKAHSQDMTELAEAAGLLQQAVDAVGADGPSIRDNRTLASLARVLDRLGRGEDAAAYFIEALRKERPEKPNAALHHWYGLWILGHKRNYREAEKHIRIALEIHESAARLNDLARVIIASGSRRRFSEAERILVRAISLSTPDFKWPERTLADLQRQKNLLHWAARRVYSSVGRILESASVLILRRGKT
jgi:tetratricopeptide (TPR) repeat protein